MKMRLLTAVFAAAALSGCATYDYIGGGAPGGYYYGRPSVEYYGPYGESYGYGYYGYYPYSYYGYYGYYPYYYYPYYLYRPYRPPRPPLPPRPPRPPLPPNQNYDQPPSQGARPATAPSRSGVPQAPSQSQSRKKPRPP